MVAAGAAAAADSAERYWPRRVRWLMRNIPWLSGSFAAGLGVFVLVGWWLQRAQWISLLGGLPPMSPNSAFMAVLAGVSLILLAPVAVSRFQWVSGRLCAGAVAVIAALTLGEHALNLDLEIDRALVTPTEALLDHYPVRPSPHVAVGFALIGTALLTLDKRIKGRRRLSRMLAVIAALIPLIALLAYVFGTAELYGARALYPYIGMGLPTAIALLALSGGTLAARANDGVLSVLVAEDSGGLAARRLVTWLFALAVVTCGVEAGARFGLYAAPIGSAGIMMLGIVGGSAFVLRVSLRLSRLDRARRAAQAEIRQSRERLELALRGGELAAWDWNLKSDEVVYHPRWAEMTGYRPDEIAPHIDSWRSSVHPDDRDAVEKALSGHLRGDTPEYESEHRVRTKSGDWIWVLARGKVFDRDPNGEPLRMAGTALDVTERRRLEDELRLAIRARDDLMGVVAHDLRNPLGTILMQASMLQELGSRGERCSEESTASIERAARRMNRLIQDLLDVTRLEAGRLSIEHAHVDTVRLLADVVDAQKPLAASRHLELRLDVPATVPPVNGDRDRLAQVLENLIGNAMKFTKAGGRVTVGAAANHREVVFCVSDTGTGIATEDVPRLFDRFWQAKPGAQHGAGLGLPIVKGIVETHGGRVWVESTPGRGSTFFFSIPVATSDAKRNG